MSRPTTAEETHGKSSPYIYSVQYKSLYTKGHSELLPSFKKNTENWNQMTCCCFPLFGYNVNVLPWFTIFWTDKMHTDLISFHSLRHLNLLWPATTLQQHYVPGKQTAYVGVPYFGFFYKRWKSRHGILSSREFLQKDDIVISVSDDDGGIMVVLSCSPGQQLCLVFEAHFKHNLCCGAVVPWKL